MLIHTSNEIVMSLLVVVAAGEIGMASKKLLSLSRLFLCCPGSLLLFPFLPFFLFYFFLIILIIGFLVCS